VKRFTVDLTAQARSGKIDPVWGAMKDRQIIDIHASSSDNPF